LFQDFPMHTRHLAVTTAVVAALVASVHVTPARAGQAPAPVQAPAPEPAPVAPDFVPMIGQQGKDVVWVPTSPELLEAMLDLAGVTSQDFVMDLGSGDGRNIIAAAKRGAHGLGVEYNPDMVELSRRMAREAGVADRAQFVQGDMYQADISKATVLALFLLPHNLEELKAKFLAMPPGTRIVMNTFTLNGWEADATTRLENGCSSWCTALLHIVPAQVAGTWTFEGGQLVLTQEFQQVTGTITRAGAEPVAVTGSLRASLLTMNVGGRTYLGRVEGNRITGTITEASGASANWSASR
jgi:precorrin-6B methylase 2